MNTSTTQPCAANLFRPLAFSFCATLLTLLLVAVSTNTLHAQTTLGPGDLAFTMMNMEGFTDQFNMVLLTDVTAGTVFFITDDEITGATNSNLNTGEGRLGLTFTAAASCGKELMFAQTNTSGATNWVVSSAGGGVSVSNGSSGPQLSSSGDALIAFQGSLNTTAPTSFITAIDNSGEGFGSGASGSTPLPAGLTEGSTAVSMPQLTGNPGGANEFDNVKYNCSTTSGIPTFLASSINTTSAWSVDDVNPFPTSGCGFTCLATCADPVINSLSSSPAAPCPNDAVTITINGSLNDANGFSLRTGSANGPVIQGPTTATQFVINPAQTTTYFVTAPNCDAMTQASSSVTITVNGVAAMAGPDQFLLAGPSEFLSANSGGPQSGTWTVVSGDGNGVFGDATAPTSTFSGTAGQSYVLRWTLSGGGCPATSDDVEISFQPTGGGTTLGLGDVAITGYQGDNPDLFSFLLLADVDAGTTISFTDNGWLSTGGFSTGEGILTLTFNRSYTCGTQFFADGSGSGYTITDAQGVVAGPTTGSGTIAFAIGGDQLFLYQGTFAAPTLITGIQMNGPWNANALSTATSAEPAAFSSNPGNSLFINPEVDNAQYDCSVSSGDPMTLRAAINNSANWNVADDLGTLDIGPTGACGFSCDNCIEPVITGLSASPDPVCAGEDVTITISGMLNGAARWVAYSGGCDGTIVASSMTNTLTFPVDATATYSVAGINGCVATPVCTDIMVNVAGQVAVISGPEQVKVDGATSTTLTATVPASGETGTWMIVEAGDGAGVISDPASSTITFSGTAGRSYRLRYTLTNSGCPTTSDEVEVAFLSPSALVLGDIAFIAYNSDDTARDGFAFVLLTDVNAGTQLFFTDRGWLAAGGFRAGEGTLGITTCRFYACGSEINVFGVPTLEVLDADGNDAATVSSGGAVPLSTSGDQLFAYVSPEPTGADQSSFLTAIQMNGDWDADATDNATSAEPSIFQTNPGNSLAIDPEVDNARFDCANAPAAANTDATRAAINDPANWLTTDTDAGYSLPLNCILGCCTDALITSVTGAGDFCDGDQVTLTVNGQLNDATEWFWYEGGCGMGTPVAMGTTYSFTFSTTVTVFVRGEGGCVGTDAECMSVMVTADMTPPTIDCSAIQPNRNNDVGECGFTMPGTGFDPTAMDNCPGVTLSNDFNNSASLMGATFPVGSTPVIWTATDAIGLTATCMITVVVTDMEAPTIDC
ncbi:MAG: HYR domain-containing protein, partial [Saprospiraceae bacterium]